MAVKVNPTTNTPTHHISLSDGTTELGFILRSGDRINPRAIERRPRQNGQYSPFTQSDWGSGRGIKDAEENRSRFADSYRLTTRHPGHAFISGQENYTTGYRDQESYMPGSLSWVSLLSSNRYIAYKLAAVASSNRAAIYLHVRRRGTPTSTLTVELCSDNVGEPGTVLKTVTKTTSDITDTVSQLVEFAFSSVYAATLSETLWIKVYTSSADDSTNYWQVGTDSADTNNLTYISTDGASSNWFSASFDLYWRLVDDTDLLGVLFFTYKQQQYFITRPTSSNAPKLYLNGYRGIATGTHSTTTLQDTTQSFTTNELAGAVLLIIDGTNSEWIQPYRTITSNDGDTITFSPAFPKAPVSADTVYVVVGSDVWTEITGHGLTVLPTSVVSAGDVLYFAQGDSVKMRRMREYVNNAVWTREFAAENNYAKYLLSYRHPSKGMVVCKTNDKGNLGDPVFAISEAQTWGRDLKFPFLIHDGESTTNWVAGTNGAIATDNTDFVSGTKSLKLTISGAPGDPILYYPISVNAGRFDSIRFYIKASANQAAGAITVFLSTAADGSSQIENLTLPAYPGSEWVEINLPYNNAAGGTQVVQSIGFSTTNTSGTYHIDSIELLVKGSETKLGNNGERLTGMERYGDPEVPWIFRTQSAGSIENGIFSPVPLREYSSAQDVHNGRGHTVHNVYLYFSFLHGLERFYRNNLDDVGPNRDEGMPSGRQGFITDMVGYIGRFFYNYDGMTIGTSAIMESGSGTDHHEVYRSSTTGRRIRNIYIQTVPGSTADRLWFTEGEDILWLPLPGNTLSELNDSTYTFTHEGYLETGWINGGDKELVKIFHNIKLFSENLSSSLPVEFDYKTDDDSSWTAGSSSFTTSPVEKITLNVSAKRIKLRFRLQTNDNTTTPVIRSLVVSATTRPETRYTFSMSTWMEDVPYDLQGTEYSSLTAATVLAQLDSWTAANTILTMRSVFSPFDNLQVLLEPVVIRPLTIILDESKERLIATLSLIVP